MDPQSSLFGWAVIFATLVGPIFAIAVSIFNAKSQGLYQKRLDIFRMLMKNRMDTLSYEFVSALNLVEIDYWGKTKVIFAHRELMTHLNVHSAQGDSQSWLTHSNDLTAKLLHEMSLVLGVTIRELDILRGGYFPRGWGTQRQTDSLMKEFFARIAKEEAAFPIRVVNIDENRPPQPGKK